MSANLLGASKAQNNLIRKLMSLALIVCVSFAPGCGGSNLFKSFATTDDDESLLRTALDAINDGHYQEAIDACILMSPDSLSSDKGSFVCASAYAGLCGYTLFTAVNQLTAWSGTPKLFEHFMEQNNGATAGKVAACGGSLDLIRASGAATSRTNDMNYLAMLSGLTNMGVILNFYADAATNDDGTPDVGWDACDSAVDFPDADATQFGTALWELYRSAEATPSSLTNNVKTLLDAASTAIDGIDMTYNFLKSTVNPASFTANQLKGVRTLIKEGQAFGLNYCANFLACKCP